MIIILGYNGYSTDYNNVNGNNSAATRKLCVNLYSCIIMHVANNGCVSSVVHCLISQKVELGS